MSDSAFKTAAYPAYTTAELSGWLADHQNGNRQFAAGQYDKICAEIARRAKRDAGDRSAMTDGERLRVPASVQDFAAAWERQEGRKPAPFQKAIAMQRLARGQTVAEIVAALIAMRVDF